MPNCDPLRGGARFQRRQTEGFLRFFRSCRLLRLRGAQCTFSVVSVVETTLTGVVSESFYDVCRQTESSGIDELDHAIPSLLARDIRNGRSAGRKTACRTALSGRCQSEYSRVWTGMLAAVAACLPRTTLLADGHIQKRDRGTSVDLGQVAIPLFQRAHLEQLRRQGRHLRLIRLRFAFRFCDLLLRLRFGGA
jgi:hypothetical protein